MPRLDPALELAYAKADRDLIRAGQPPKYSHLYGRPPSDAELGDAIGPAIFAQTQFWSTKTNSSMAAGAALAARRRAEHRWEDMEMRRRIRDAFGPRTPWS